MEGKSKGKQLWEATDSSETEAGLRLIQETDTDINWTNQGRDGSTALHRAARWNNLPLLAALLARRDALPNSLSFQGTSPLAVACQFGREQAAALLLADGRVDVNLAAAARASPVWLAVLQGQGKVLKLLLASAPSVDVTAQPAAAQAQAQAQAHAAGSSPGSSPVPSSSSPAASGSSPVPSSSSPAEVARKAGRGEMAALLDAYLDDPIKVVLELRRELGLQSWFFFSFSLFLFFFFFSFRTVSAALSFSCLGV